MKKTKISSEIINNIQGLKKELDKFNNIGDLINHYQKTQNNEFAWDFEYYLKILKMVAENLQNNNYLLALKDLEEELEASYLSQNVEAYLVSAQKLVRSAAYEKNNSEIAKMDRKQLINLAIDDFPKNLQIFDYFTSKPSNFFQIEDLDYFRFIFSSKEIKNSLKSTVLLFLNEIPDFFNLKLNIKNFNTNKNYEIIIGKSFINDETEKFYNKVFLEISNLMNKDPSLEEMANSVVDQFINYYFPDHPDCDPILLAKKIVEYIFLSLNNNSVKKSKLSDDKITTLIQTVLKSI